MKKFLSILLISLSASGLSASEDSAAPTFSEHIAPIVFEKCVSCHRPGEAAPFSLTDYAAVKRRAKTIQRVVVEEGIMPPWHPEEGWGEFRGDRSLDEAQIALLDRWVEAGAPEGDPEKTPKLPEFPEGWYLGEPDLVVEMPEAFEIHAEGKDIYRYFPLPLNQAEDKWVRAVEVRPSARSVVHHALFFLDDKGVARKLDAADPKPGFRGKGFRQTGSLGGWAVGGTPLDLSNDYALPLPKGSDLVLQTHFHPTGKIEHEQTKIGIYFADGPPEKPLVEFQIPPGFGSRTGLNVGPKESNYEIRDHLIVPRDMELISVWGHAHQVCTSMQAEATLPDGTKQKLFRIGDWDFNWQGQYAYAEPVRLPKDTRIDVVITYDNTADNPANPYSPPRRIFWGQESTDEMGSLIFQCVAANKIQTPALRLGLAVQKQQSHVRFRENLKTAIRRGIVLRLDTDHDDRLSREETPPEHLGLFAQLDGNGDGFVDVKEITERGSVLDRLSPKGKKR